MSGLERNTPTMNPQFRVLEIQLFMKSLFRKNGKRNSLETQNSRVCYWSQEYFKASRGLLSAVLIIGSVFYILPALSV